MPPNAGHRSGYPDGDESAFRQIAESVREIIWLLDPTGTRMLYVNPAYESITGHSIETLRRDPKAWLEAVYPDDRARIDDLARARDHDIELRIVRPDGEVRWLWVRGGPLLDGRGRVRGIVDVAEDVTRRKRAEEELDRSLALLHATLDATADGILALDLEGRVTAFNRRFSELWRMPDSLAIEAGGEAELWSWMRDQVRDPAAFDAEMAQAAKHPETDGFDVIEFKDGRVFERYSQPERLADRMIGRVWSFRDTTARTNAERALRRRTRRLEIQNETLLRLARRRIKDLADRRASFEQIAEIAAEILETERVGIWLFEDDHGRIRLDALYHRSAGHRAGGTVLARDLAPSYFAAIEAERTVSVDDVHQDPRTRELAQPYCAPLGITSMLDAPIRAVGRLMGIVCFEQVGPRRSWTIEDESFAASIGDFVSIAIEAAERERADSRLRFLAHESEILGSSLDYEATLASVTRLVTSSMADWCLVDILENHGLRQVAGAHVVENKENLVREVVARYPVTPGSAHLGAVALRTGEPQLLTDATDEGIRRYTVDAHHLELIRRMGARSFMAVPLKARGRTIGVVSFGSARRNFDDDDLLFAQDVASRAATAIDNARLHELAQQASQAKSEFLAVMSHELRTPLSAIMGHARLLEEGVHGDVSPKQRQVLERIQLRSGDLLRTLEEILAYSRTESGVERPANERVDVARLLRESEAVIRPLAEERGLEFDLRPPQRPLTLITDPGKLKHILLNLLSNAVKFTARGRITLESGREDDHVVFRVSDTGRGIAKEDQARIFDPFAQVDTALTRETGGTGLGLAVVARLTRLLGGAVTVESEPGAGSTFTVRLPAAPDQAREEAA